MICLQIQALFLAPTVNTLKRLRVNFSRVRAIDSCQQRSLSYNCGPRRQSNCQTQRQTEAQMPNKEKLRTCTRCKIDAQFKAFFC